MCWRPLGGSIGVSTVAGLPATVLGDVPIGVLVRQGAPALGVGPVALEAFSVSVRDGRNPPPSVRDSDDGRQIVLDQQYTHDDVVALAFEEVRLAAAGLPAVCVHLLEAMALIHESLADTGRPAQAGLVAAQAGLVVEGCATADVLPVDLDHVRAARGKRFGTAGTGVAAATDAAAPLL